MALTTKIGGQPSPIQKELEHVSKSITDGNATSLITGITGKKIRIWRISIFIGTTNKTCEFLSGANSFISVCSVKTLHQLFKSSEGIPVYTCNDGEDFKADPSDSTNWYFYIVYSIE